MPEETLAALDVGELASWWREVLLDSDRIVFVATSDDGTVVGFAHAAATDDEEGSPDVAQLYAIYLEERATGRGIGGALLARVTGEMRRAGFTRATLWVLETNERARRFYEHAGWTWDGTRSTHQVECSNLPIVRYRVGCHTRGPGRRSDELLAGGGVRADNAHDLVLDRLRAGLVHAAREDRERGPRVLALEPDPAREGRHVDQGAGLGS